MLWLAYQIVSGMIMFCVGTCGVAWLIHRDQTSYCPTGKIGIVILTSTTMGGVVILSTVAYAVIPFLLVAPILAVPPFIVYKVATKFSLKSLINKILKGLSE